VARTLGCGGMEQSVYDDQNEQQGKPKRILRLKNSKESDSDNYNKL